MSTEDRIRELDEIHKELSNRLNGFRVYLKYAVPDWILNQFGIDVLEQSIAVLRVATGPAPRAAIANARAAFEASMDMLVLVAEPAMYEELGAFARVCEMLEWEELREKRGKADNRLGLEPIKDNEPPENIVEQEAAIWEQDNRGITTMYRRVLTQAKEERRWRHHWSGMGTLQERAAYVENKFGAYNGFAEIANVLWGLQSIHSHPSPRSGGRALSRNDRGQLVIGPKADDPDFPIAMATVAVRHALEALARRAEMIK